MSGNTFGTLFAVTNFGESHGPAIGCVIDGCPPGMALSEADIQGDLDRRRPGTSRHVTQRNEPDAVPAGLAGAAEVEAARSTLGGAVALASQLTGSAGAELLDAGRAALLHGLRLTAGICAAVLLVVAGLVAFRLRGAGEANAPRTPGAAALPER